MACGKNSGCKGSEDSGHLMYSMFNVRLTIKINAFVSLEKYEHRVMFSFSFLWMSHI